MTQSETVICLYRVREGREDQVLSELMEIYQVANR